MDKNYCLYWIHYVEHQNPYEDGYIGISANLQYRIQRYKQPGQKSRLLDKFQNGAIVTVLAKNLLHHEAMLLEKKFREYRNIGWNLNSGGFMPPIPERNLP